jgi:HEAT repeat protein
MRSAAERAVDQILENQPLESIESCLKSQSSVVRAKAVRCLGYSEDTEALVLLGRILQNKDEDSTVRIEAAVALARIDDPEVAEPLYKALADDDAMVSAAAASALLQARHSGVRLGRIEALALDGRQDGIDALVSELEEGDLDDETRTEIVQLLARVAELKTLEPTAARSVGSALWNEYGEEAPMDAIYAIVRGLRHVGTVDMVPNLLGDMVEADEDRYSVRFAGEVLATLQGILARDGEEGFATVVYWLYDRWPLPLSDGIVTLLDDWKDLRAAPLLEAIASDDRKSVWSVQDTARRALERLEPMKTADRLARMLETDYGYERWWAARELAAKGDVRARVALEESLLDGDATSEERRQAAGLLGQLGESSSLAALERVAHVEDPGLSAAIEEAMNRIRRHTESLSD